MLELVYLRALLSLYLRALLLSCYARFLLSYLPVFRVVTPHILLLFLHFGVLQFIVSFVVNGILVILQHAGTTNQLPTNTPEALYSEVALNEEIYGRNSVNLSDF